MPMIEYGIEDALRRVTSVIRVLKQVTPHPEVSIEQAGNALAEAGVLVEALKNLQSLSAGISSEDICSTEEFLRQLEKEDGSTHQENFSSIRRILDQQKKLADLQNMELNSLHESLRDTNIILDIPNPLEIGRWLRERGYKVCVGSMLVYRNHQGNEVGRSIRWDYTTDIKSEDTLLGVYRQEVKREEGTSFFGLKKYVRQKKLMKRISGLDLSSKPWKMNIRGRSTLPEALLLARGLDEWVKEEINVTLVSEEDYCIDTKSFYNWFHFI